MVTISKQEARDFLIKHQGLGGQPEFNTKSILDFIKRVGCIQFDPLNIVGNNPDLVLQARIPKYKPAQLATLMYKDRSLLDGWDKNMSIYGTEDWPYFQRRRSAARKNDRISGGQIEKVFPEVRKALRMRGPLSSLDLKLDDKVNWSWAPARLAKAALESMYFRGELTIHHRIHTRRVYDFMENHFPAELLTGSDPNVSDDQFHDWYVHRRIGSVGLIWNRAGDAWLGMSGIKSPERRTALARLLKQGLVREIKVAGIKDMFYLRSDDHDRLLSNRDNKTIKSRAVIIAPLDNLLWDRRLVRTLFDFDYIWEVYKPVKERRFGYYVLPILYRDKFIARFEPGVDKQSKTLIVKKWWWEPGVKQTARMYADLNLCFKRFLVYLGYDEISIETQAPAATHLDWLIT